MCHGLKSNRFIIENKYFSILHSENGNITYARQCCVYLHYGKVHSNIQLSVESLILQPRSKAKASTVQKKPFCFCIHPFNTIACTRYCVHVPQLNDCTSLASLCVFQFLFQFTVHIGE